MFRAGAGAHKSGGERRAAPVPEPHNLGGLVAAIPVPRTPRCYTHCVWHAGCPDCCDQRRAEQTAAKARLEAERRRVEAGAL